MSDIYLNFNLNIKCKKLKIKESNVYNIYRYCTVYLKYTLRDINLKKGNQRTYSQCIGVELCPISPFILK